MNKYIYMIVTILILFLVGTLFIRLLPFLIIAGVIIYAITTIKGRINRREEDKIKNNYGNYNTNNDDVEDLYNTSEDYTNGEIIDVVEYEDVDKK